jgi:hypothetical protein
MLKKLVLALACGALTAISFDAHAFPASAPTQMAAPGVTTVRGFCGLGFHRGPYGYCVRNGTPYVYAPPVVLAPPVVVAPPVLAPMCPYGYHLGPYGRCIPW